MKREITVQWINECKATSYLYPYKPIRVSSGYYFLYDAKSTDLLDIENTQDGWIARLEDKWQSEPFRTLKECVEYFTPNLYDSIFGQIEPESENKPENPREENFTMSTSSNKTICVVKIINERTGKFEITESSNHSVILPNNVGTSLYLVGKDLNSTWRVEIRVTGKGSLKIDDVIARHDISSGTIHQATDPRESGSVQEESTVEPEPAQESKPESIQPEKKEENNISSHSLPIADKPIVLSKNPQTWDEPDYFISPDAKLVFSIAYRMLQSDPDRAIKILIKGASGLGKTTIAERFAKWSGLDVIRVNCAAIRDPEEWFFDREVKPKIVTDDNGKILGIVPETIFTPSLFAQKIARGNCLVILDELNRTEPNNHNTLFPLLDDSQKTNLHHTEFTVGPNVIFVATVNLGFEFDGIFNLDNALINRFDLPLEVYHLPFDHEIALLESVYSIQSDQAYQIVDLARSIRENGLTCSTRDTLRIAKLVSHGMSLRDAFEFGVILRIPNHDDSGAIVRKDTTDLVNGTLGAIDPVARLSI